MKNLLLILLLLVPINSYCQVSRSFENDDLKPFKEGNLYGFKNKAGEIVVQPRYERIYEFHEGMCRVRRGYVNCYIDSTGKEVNIDLLDKGTNYHEIGDFHDGLALIHYCDNKRHCGYGYIDKNGVLVSEDIYGLANNYSEGRAFVCKWNSRKWEIIDEKGNNIGSEKYDHIGELTQKVYIFSEGMALVRCKNNWKYIDRSGKTIIKLPKESSIVDEASVFSEGLTWYMIVRKEGNYINLIDKEGNIIISSEYLNPSPFKDGYSFCWKYDNIGLIHQPDLGVLYNKQGEILAEYNLKEEKLNDYKDDIMHIQKLADFFYGCNDDGIKSPLRKAYKLYLELASLGNSSAQYKVGLMTQYGQGTKINEQEAIKWYKKSNEPEAKKQLAMIEGNASNADIVTVTDIILQKNEDDTKDVVKESVLQKDSIAQIPRLYINEDEYYVKGGKAYNRQGKLVLSSEKYLIKSYSDGRFRVISQNNLYGFVDILGNEIIPCQYEDARDFRDGVARVCKKIASDRVRKWGYIDKNGKQVLPFSYGHVSGDFSQGLAYVAKSNQSSIINKKGEIVKKLKISNYNLTPPGDHFLPRVANYTYFSEGVIWLSVGNRLFLVNTNGDIEKEIDLKEIEKAFNGKLWEVDEVYPFKRGLSLLRFEDYDNKIKIGYLYNKDGNVVAKYDFVNNKVFDEYKSDTTAIVKIAEFFYDNDRLNSAFELFRQASSLGNSRAQYIVGFMTQYGQSIEANEKEAIKWYKKSNDPEAKKQLAMLERKGEVSKPQIQDDPITQAKQDYKNPNVNTVIVNHHYDEATETKTEKIDCVNNDVEVKSQIVALNNIQSVEPKKRERGIALIIGNAAYDHTKHLNSPIKDAEDIGLSLKKLGFEVMVERNLNSRQQKEVIDRFTSDAENYDVAIFYYSGHGIQIKNENYLLPTDFKGEKESELYYCARPRGVIEDLDQAGCNLKIIIIDACRDNPFSMSKGGSSGLAPMEGTAGTYIVYATAENKTAVDGKVGENSRFTKALLHALNKPGLNLHEVFDVVGEEVGKESNGTQLPKVNHQPPIGKFIFNNR